MGENKMKRNILLGAVLVTVVAVLVISCKGGDDNPSAGGSDTTPPIISDGSDATPPPTTSSNLPPDPGEAGKATLAGIDSDNDGVRDDIQIAIFKRYPDDEIKRKALTQNAKALQDAVVAGNSLDTDAIFQASKSVINAVDCLSKKGIDGSFVENNIVNTSERSEAYIEFNSTLNGQFFGDGDENPCE